MKECSHCGTHFVPKNPTDQFCCHGCEFVHEMIHDGGFDQYYQLRNGQAGSPVMSVPFEAHDFRDLRKIVDATNQEDASQHVATATFSVDGISCIGCVWLIEKLILRHSGTLEAAANPGNGCLHLKWQRHVLNIEALAAELVRFGYTLRAKKSSASLSEAKLLGTRLGLCGAFMLNAMAFSLPSYLGMPKDMPFAHLFELITFLTATLSMLVGGTYFMTRAWQALRMKSLHIDLPIALGLIVAYFGSIGGWLLEHRELFYFDFVSTFVFLMLGGRFVQISALEKNRHRMQRQRSVPAQVRSDEDSTQLELSEIEIGKRYWLESGQAVPVASTLAGDPADFSLEWIHGEAEPCTYSPGRSLPAGAIHLGQRPILLRANEQWSDSLLAKLVDEHVAPIRLPAIEKMLKIYLCMVLAVGFIGFGFWYHASGLTAALQVMISIFIVSCPCALGVSLPLADDLAGSHMQRLGVFIRQPMLWGRLRRVRKVIFDKTGTLTIERPQLLEPEALERLSFEQRLALARLTCRSLHPVSRTLLEALGFEGQKILNEHHEVDVIDAPGMGRYFSDKGHQWSLGKPGWKSTSQAITEARQDAVLCCDGDVIAHFQFQDSLRQDAQKTVSWLLDRGFRTVILSGDRQEKVSLAAEQLGIPAGDAHACLLPDEKETLVRSLDQHDTLYLGDGANDSLAFNAAWTAGTPVVDQSLLEHKADFYFMGHSMRFLPSMLQLAKRRYQVVRAAFVIALVYNLVVRRDQYFRPHESFAGRDCDAAELCGLFGDCCRWHAPETISTIPLVIP
ncbi:MAG: HAD family hydrolase [Verrucomicrobia bacterium]|nr:MAG: HAD family hydrolase [Verrucomicrobiota bacterium]